MNTKPAPYVVSPLAAVRVYRVNDARLWRWGVLMTGVTIVRHRTKKAAMAHARRIRGAIGK